MMKCLPLPSPTTRRGSVGGSRIFGPIIVLLILLLFPSLARPQNAGVAPSTSGPKIVETDLSDRLIRGVVVDEDGRPLSGAQVYLYAVDPPFRAGSNQTSATLPDGSFRFNGVGPGSYRVQVWTRGYLSPDRGDPIYHAGDNIRITLRKGGVITGAVTDLLGAPLALVRVRATRVRDVSGRGLQWALSSEEAITDDRGIYRIYGLSAGSYVVATGAVSGLLGDYGRAADVLDGTTYYPSAPMDGATEVAVNLGQETAGINVQVRPETGHRISGRILGVRSSLVGINGVELTLHRANNGLVESSTVIQERNGTYAFAFPNLPDGDYVLRAARKWLEDRSAAPLVPVRIKGADVDGIVMNLLPLGSVAGRIQLVQDRPSNDPPQCEPNQAPVDFDRFQIVLRREAKTELAALEAALGVPDIFIDQKGGFQAENVGPGTYWPRVTFPDDQYFLSSLTPRGAEGYPANANHTGWSIVSGGKLDGVVISLASGAAAVKGTIIAGRMAARSPARILVHLVPAGKGSADDVLRYYEVEADPDRAFALKNLAPGRYWIYAAEAVDTDLRPSLVRPVAWDSAARHKLRRAAEMANVTLELKPCQRVTDYIFNWNPKAATVAPR